MYVSCFSIQEVLSSLYTSTFNLSSTHPPMDTPGATRSSESFPETLRHRDRRYTDVPTDPTLGTRIRVTHNRTSHSIPILIMFIRLTKNTATCSADSQVMPISHHLDSAVMFFVSMQVPGQNCCTFTWKRAPLIEA